LQLALDDGRRHRELESDAIDKLQAKIKQLKLQAEEAEALVATNYAKYRQALHMLEDAGERADGAESYLSRNRKGRSSSAAPVTRYSSVSQLNMSE